jgi:arsenite methyltransferase
MNEAILATARIRAARLADLPAVESLLEASGLPLEGVAEQFENVFAVAESGGEVVGMAGVEVYGAHGLLRSVAVAAHHQGEGIGQRLLAERLVWASARGLHSVYLLTTTAAKWFHRLGFVAVTRDDVPAAVRRSAEFAGICPSTATVMERRLMPQSVSCCGTAPTPIRRAPTSTPGVPPAGRLDADPDTLKSSVRVKYGAAAARAADGGRASCCGPVAEQVWDPITSDLYTDAETAGLPAEALLASLGCGNPTALAELRAGDVVLDLGSGGGIDVLLSARRVGPTGYAFGLDMTDRMLELARQNQERAGATNVQFLKGDIESIPLPDASVDVIISNCVINLAADKGAALREAFRVLKPGGRFAVSDIVARREIPAEIRTSIELWMGCVAGALRETEYLELLRDAGFRDSSVEPTRLYTAADARHFLSTAALPVPERLDEYDGAFMSAFVRATKPVTA